MTVYVLFTDKEGALDKRIATHFKETAGLASATHQGKTYTGMFNGTAFVFEGGEDEHFYAGIGARDRWTDPKNGDVVFDLTQHKLIGKQFILKQSGIHTLNSWMVS